MDDSDDEIPAEFLCPIGNVPMAYPFFTTAGNSYEYAAISLWFSRGNRRDPLSNVELEDTTLVPNNSLRSQILRWFEEHPRADKSVLKVPRPPADAFHGGKKVDAKPGQDKIFKYRGSSNRKDERAKQKAAVPPCMAAHGHTYTFSRPAPDGQRGDSLFVRCDGGATIEMPDKAMFATPQGLIFYDPTEMRDARVLPGTDLSEACKFGVKCSRDPCAFAHPFVCPNGFGCRCRKFLHPDASTVTALGPAYPLNTQCRYGTSCSNSTCHFAHPRGRMAVPRHPARLALTHSLTLDVLPSPRELRLNIPDGATVFQFQGEFVLFFRPYPGTWAKQHFEAVIVHRFNARTMAFEQVGVFSLERHYCNSAVARGRYMVISFWPYEEEAIRTLWECLRISRAMEKELRNKQLQVQRLQVKLDEANQVIVRLDGAVARGDAQIRQMSRVIEQQQAQLASTRAAAAEAERRAAEAERRAAEADRQAADAARKAALVKQALERAREDQRAAEETWRRQRLDYERERNERLRYRDPIHIYALQAGKTGFAKEDWKLVLDYHKGAHDLDLHAPDANGVQRLDITEHDNVFKFDLVVPHDVSSLGALIPLVPGRLCDDF